MTTTTPTQVKNPHEMEAGFRKVNLSKSQQRGRLKHAPPTRLDVKPRGPYS